MTISMAPAGKSDAHAPRTNMSADVLLTERANALNERLRELEETLKRTVAAVEAPRGTTPTRTARW